MLQKYLKRLNLRNVPSLKATRLKTKARHEIEEQEVPFSIFILKIFQKRE